MRRLPIVCEQLSDPPLLPQQQPKTRSLPEDQVPSLEPPRAGHPAVGGAATHQLGADSGDESSTSTRGGLPPSSLQAGMNDSTQILGP